MRTTAKRVVAVALALLGLVLGAGGAWFATQLGSTGTATFTTQPPDTRAVVLTPSMLGRVDATVKVSASAAEGDVWIGVARPSDAQAALADGAHREAIGVEVSGWVLTTATRGSGELSAMSRGDVWHEQVTGPGTQSLSLEQANAPETVVISAGDGTIKQVTVAYTRKAWFVQSVVAAIIGLFLMLAGALLWRLRLGGADDAAADESPVPVPSAVEMAPTPTRRSSPLSKVPWPGRQASAADPDDLDDLDDDYTVPRRDLGDPQAADEAKKEEQA